MANHKISTYVTQTVQMGGADYGSHLYISSTGTVAPLAFGADGIVAIVPNVHLRNAGHIAGRAGYNNPGGIGVDLTSGGDQLRNSGSITGGYSGYPTSGTVGVAGGNGVDISTGLVVNTGTITGGIGSYSNYGNSPGPGHGGVGVSLAGSKLINAGLISGGTGGSGYNDANTGGTGVDLGAGAAASHASNTGTIEGGKGGYATKTHGGSGGTGLTLGAGDTLSNSGLIAGGTGQGGNGVFYQGGNGGIGIDISGGTVVNSGAIAGGNGAASYYYAGGNGGAGVRLNGGTLVTSGTISGGAGAYGYTHGTNGDAVQFGSLASRLVLEPGAVFNGLVVANAGVNDILALAGSAGTLSGLGTEFTGFTAIAENAGAKWTLAGSNTLGTSTTLRVHGQLSLGGTLTDTGLTSITAGGTLLAANASVSTLGSLFLDDGTVKASAGATLVIGQTDAGAAAGVITIQSGASLGGDGTVAGALANNGSIVAVSGTLAFLGDVTGTGAVRIVSGAAVTVATSLDDKSVSFDAGGTGILALASGASVSATLMSFSSGDTLHLQSSADSLSFSAGTLTLSEGSTVIDRFTLAGDYLQSDFHLAQTQTGTDVTYSAAAQDIESHHLPLLAFWHV